MAGWHHWLDGCESEWTPGVGDGQGGLASCNSWGRKESDTTERLNWTELRNVYSVFSVISWRDKIKKKKFEEVFHVSLQGTHVQVQKHAPGRILLGLSLGKIVLSMF